MDLAIPVVLLAVGASLIAVLYGAAIARAARDDIQRPTLPANDEPQRATPRPAET